MYKLRIKIFLGVLAGVWLLLAGKLVQLQVIQGEQYRRQAEEAMRSVKVLPVMRGKITDRKGRILALDEPCFDFCLDYRFITADKAWIRYQKRQIARRGKLSKAEAADVYERRSERAWATARRLADAAGVDIDEQVRRIVERVQAVRRIVNRNRIVEITVRDERQAHPVVTGLDTPAALELRTQVGEMIGAQVRPSFKRWYPYGRDACHIIGMTGKVWPEEMGSLNLKADQADWLTRMRTNYLPDDTIGKVGVEKMCEKVLRGHRGYKRYRLSGETLHEEPTVQGADVHLTLDVVLQRRVAALLEAKGNTGSAIVLGLGTHEHPRNEVLALVSVPTYDLNEYTSKYNELLADTVNLPLLHRAIVQRYPPGSTVKPIVALTGLSVGAIDIGTTIHCRGYLYEPTAFRCWTWKHGYGHGDLAVVEAIQRSCNVFFYEVGNRVNPTRMCHWLNLLGFGGKCGTGLPCERAGTVPTEDWLMAHYGRRYRPGDVRFMAIGQGLLTATPLHLADAVAAIAQGGVFMTPMLALEGAPQQVRRELPVRAEHIHAVQEGMYRVVNNRFGTAWKYFHGPGTVPLDGIELCGKTGTAETAPQRVDSNGNGRIDRGDRVVRTGDTAWFVGFAPHGRPQIAFAVAIEYVAGGGGKNAAPVANEIVRICQEMGYVK